VGESATLTVTGANGTYTWNTSANASTIIVSPTVTTTYSVTGTNTNNCSSQSQFVQNVSPCTDIAELDKENAISIYPNPATSEIFIYSSISESMVVEIYNTIGELVYVDNNYHNSKAIELKNVSKGLYHIAVKVNNELVNTKKLIVH
jgi:hypothetical protein